MKLEKGWIFMQPGYPTRYNPSITLKQHGIFLLHLQQVQPFAVLPMEDDSKSGVRERHAALEVHLDIYQGRLTGVGEGNGY